jgi:hypothetical protein
MEARDSTREVLLKFWKVVELNHGLPNGTHKTTKSEAEHMLAALATEGASEAQALRQIRDDPAGARSLFQVTFYKAALEGWETSTAIGLKSAKTPGVELKLRALAPFSFCTAAIIEFPYVKQLV